MFRDDTAAKLERRRRQVREAQARFRDRKDRELEEIRLQAETLFCELHRARDEIDSLRARLSRYEDVGESDMNTTSAGGSGSSSSGSSRDGRVAAAAVGPGAGHLSQLGAGHLNQLQRRVSAPATGVRPQSQPQGPVKLEVHQAVPWDTVSNSTSSTPRNVPSSSLASGMVGSSSSSYTSMALMPNHLGLEPVSQAAPPTPYQPAITSLPSEALTPKAAGNAVLSDLPWTGSYGAAAVSERLLSTRQSLTSGPGPSSSSSISDNVSSSMTGPSTVARAHLYPEDVFWAAHLMGTTAAVEGTQWAATTTTTTESLAHRSIYATEAARAARPEPDSRLG